MPRSARMRTSVFPSHLPVRTKHDFHFCLALSDLRRNSFISIRIPLVSSQYHLLHLRPLSQASQPPSCWENGEKQTSTRSVIDFPHSNMAAKRILSPDRHNSKQFACGHWGYKASSACLVGLFMETCAPSLSHVISAIPRMKPCGEIIMGNYKYC